MLRLSAILGASSALALAATPQTTGNQNEPVPVASPSPTATPSPSARVPAKPGDIIVTGIPYIGPHPPVTVRDQPSEALGIRALSEQSEQFARCATHLKPRLLRNVIDGAPNSDSADVALDRLMRSDLACIPNVPIQQPPSYGGCRPKPVSIFHEECQSFFDRAAILDHAIAKYAPDLRLTPAETNDPAVQARFNKREVPRNRFRLKPDFGYFEIAVCMVRLQPRLATELVHRPPGSTAEGPIEKALIVRARLCVGDAKDVVVDPTQFRAYIVDAAYRWAVAVGSGDSLIPLGRHTAARR